MKKVFLIVLMLFFITLTACSAKKEFNFNNRTYKLIDSTLESNTFTYTYQSGTDTIVVSEKDKIYTVIYDNTTYTINGNSVSFPNGTCTLSGNKDSGLRSGTCSVGSYDENAFDLIKLIEDEFITSSFKEDYIFYSIILFIVGILCIAAPRFTWLVNEGWKYKNVEPSELYIGYSVFMGFIAIIIGFVLFIMAF